MIAFPLVARELQAESQRAFTYGLRVIGAGAVVVAFALTSLSLQAAPSQVGALLFRSLNLALTLAIWTVVPILTADCVSREKREGTLGLLLLTPLTMREIVLSKAVIHGLRAMTLLLAALPILALPLMLGGVPWQWAVYVGFAHASALLFALAAGLLASVRNTEWTPALISAEVFSSFFALCFSGFGYWAWHWIGFRNAMGAMLIFILLRFLKQAGAAKAGFLCGTLVRSFGAEWERKHRLDWPAKVAWMIAFVLFLAGMALLQIVPGFGVGTLITATGVLVFVILFSAAELKKNWQSSLDVHSEPGWVKIFSTSAFWQALFHWNKRRTLDRNPIAWLQEYSWTARLTKWVWCMVILLGELFGIFSRNFPIYQSRLQALLILGLAFSASGSFRRERQTGALELLLVTPLQARQLIQGRLWGIWGHFLPGMAVLYSCWSMAPYHHDAVSLTGICFGISTFLFLPVIGLDVSLFKLNFLMAWLTTCFIGLVLPWAGMVLVDRLASAPHAGLAFMCGWQALAGALAGAQLYHHLHYRTFSFHDPAG